MNIDVFYGKICVLCCSSLGSGGNSLGVKTALKQVEFIYTTERAFAAQLKDGSVVKDM